MRKITKQVAALISVPLAVSACSSTTSNTHSAPPSDAISQMEIAFDDSPRQSVIKESMDKAFAAVNMTASEDNLSRAGSVLVEFRKKYGISEMEILDCIPYRADDPRAPQVNFGTIAAVCVTDLASGIKVP